ncbi:MAG TPA: hypothetical protein VMF06_01770 [Candidatus Limnocylindria bacterium]|nr:hypothetical protein [Candidatus Limnocylindria bacterium]
MKPISNPTPPRSEVTETSKQGQVTMVRRRRTGSATRSLTIAAAMLVGLVILGVAAKFLYPVAKRIRAHSIADETLVLIETGRLDEALAKLPVILRLAKDDPQVLRAVARYCASRSIPNSLEYWEKLRATDMATVEDLLGFVEAALNANRTDLSAPVIANLVSTYSQRVDVMQLGIRHLEAAGFPDRAIALARRALMVEPFNPKSERVLGQLLLHTGDATSAGEGKTLLWSVAEQPGPEREAAIGALADFRGLTPAEMERLIQILEIDATSDPLRRLRVLDLRWRSNPANHPAVAEAVGQWLRTETVETNLSLVAGWAVKNSPSMVVDAFDASVVATNKLRLLHLSDALAELGRWPQLNTLLEKNEKAYPVYAMDMLRGRQAAAAKQNSIAEKYFLSAGLDAGTDERKLALAATTSESLGFVSVALRIWEQLSNVRERSVVATSQILRLCANRDELATEQRALQRLSSQIPNDTRLAAESGERNALVNVDVAPALVALEKQIALEPNEPRWRVAAALAELRLNNPSAALTRLEQLNATNASLSPREKAIYAAILGANQQREAARRYARQIASETLKSQEKELIEPYL